MGENMLNSIRNPRRLLALAVCVGVCGIAQPLHAQNQQMYTWTDENGVVHFSDQAPPGRDVQPQELPESPKPGSVSPAPPTAGEPAEAAPSVAQQRREEIARKAEENRARQEEARIQCANWRAELDRLEPNRRVFYTNEEGETERMDDVERTGRVAELHDLIDKNCD
jgi:hypothetical protein